MKIILSTTNQSKAVQIGSIFADSVFNVLTLKEAGIEGEAIENGETLEENALLKALFAFEEASDGNITMADDTGMFTYAFPEWPGVKSARWAGDVPTEEITKKFLERMCGVKDRRATFRTIVAVVMPDASEHLFVGEVRGTILESPRTPPQPKMPYSGIFVPDGTNKVWAEMSTEEENAISHRGIAFRRARAFLEEKLK